MNLSDAIKEAYANAPAATTYYETLEIGCTDFSGSILLVNSFAPIIRNEGTFLPVRFEAKLPETAGGVRGEMTIQVTGVPKEVRAEIRNGTTSSNPITITWRQYINSSMAPDAYFPTPLEVASISESHIGIEIKALMPDLVGTFFPRKMMTTTKLPGLK